MARQRIVTEWFRVEAVWPLLAEQLARVPEPVVWSGACGTGQEAYSAAITLEKSGIAGEVLATDVDEGHLEVARAARYERRALQLEIEENRLHTSDLDRWFEPDDDERYLRVQGHIRDRVTFRQLRLGVDEPPECDTAMLRNVWRFLAPGQQRQAMAAVRQALRPEGRLWLGGGDLMRPDSSGFSLVPVSPAGLRDHFARAEHSLVWRAKAPASQP